MEDINNTNVDNQVIDNNSQSTEQLIPPTHPKQNNFFKWLSFILIFVLLVVIVMGFLIFKNYTKETVIKETNNQVQTIEDPKTVPTEAIIKNIQNTYEATSIQDDTDSISKLFLKDDQGNETIIDKQSYWKLGETDIVIKPSYSNFVFSPNNNFLSYMKGGYEGGQSFLYDIKNKQKIDRLGFYAYLDIGFTPDSKYFYGCSEHGIMNGGAIIIDLIRSTPIYKKEGSFNCTYDLNNNSLSLMEEFLISGEKKTTLFSFTKGDFIK
jgi:hypothetical protein